MKIDLRGPADQAAIREVRRWLRDQLNVRPYARKPPPLAGLWKGDANDAARAFAVALERLVGLGRCTRAEAEAWSDAAALEGRRITKKAISTALGRSVRGLDLRLAMIDKALADLINAERTPPPSCGGSPVAMQMLYESARKRVHGSVDEADGFYSAAADTEGIGLRSRARSQGRDRTRRARARRAAALQFARAPGLGIQLDRLSWATGEDQDLAVVSCTLHEHPLLALQELEDAWQKGDVIAYPLLLDNAARLIPEVGAAGAQSRLRLLEIGCNVLRDSESLLALGWAMSWVREAGMHLGPNDNQVIKARRDLGHVLQLHGFLLSAARQLDIAIESLPRTEISGVHYRAELTNLLIRRSSIEVAAGSAGQLPYARSLLRKAIRLQYKPLEPALVRNQLQLASIQYAENRERRTFSSHHRTQDYEDALVDLSRIAASADGSARYAVWDTMIAAATRVGDVQAIRHAVQAVQALPPLNSSANIFERLRKRILVASTEIACVRDLRDVSIIVPVNPLRIRALLPDDPRFLV
jgi:hypothetical protein